MAVTAVVAWIVTSGFLAWAATPKRQTDFPGSLSAEQLVSWVINDSARMEALVEKRLRLAAQATVLSLILTLATFTLFLFKADANDWRPARVLLELPLPSVGQCPGKEANSVLLEAASLDSEYVRIRAGCTELGNRELWIRSSEVQLVEFSD